MGIPIAIFTIYCGEDAQVLHVSKEAVAVFLEHYAFTMEFVRMLSMNSQKLNQKMTMAMHRSLRENLLDYLRQQAMLQGSEEILLPISKKQLADYLGVRRPSLFRELKKRQGDRLLESSNRKIRLLTKGEREEGEMMDLPIFEKSLRSPHSFPLKGSWL